MLSIEVHMREICRVHGDRVFVPKLNTTADYGIFYYYENTPYVPVSMLVVGARHRS